MPTPHALPIALSADHRPHLVRLVRAHPSPHSLAKRARIILRSADEDRPTNLRIALELGCDNDTVGLWRRRFAQRGIPGLLDAPRSGRPRSTPPPTAPSRP